MGYATVDFYKNTYHGNSIPDADIQDRLDKASFDVDFLTRMRIHQLGGFDKLSEFRKTQVQMATCYQADYSYTKASMPGVASYSMGDVSVGFDLNKSHSSECISCLDSTGLTYRGL